MNVTTREILYSSVRGLFPRSFALSHSFANVKFYPIASGSSNRRRIRMFLTFCFVHAGIRVNTIVSFYELPPMNYSMQLFTVRWKLMAIRWNLSFFTSSLIALSFVNVRRQVHSRSFRSMLRQFKCSGLFNF